MIRKIHRGFAIHFRDPAPRLQAHNKNSEMCVVCKGYFHSNRITWVRKPEGDYPMCPDCASRDRYIVENVKVTTYTA